MAHEHRSHLWDRQTDSAVVSFVRGSAQHCPLCHPACAHGDPRECCSCPCQERYFLCQWICVFLCQKTNKQKRFKFFFRAGTLGAWCSARTWWAAPPGRAFVGVVRPVWSVLRRLPLRLPEALLESSVGSVHLPVYLHFLDYLCNHNIWAPK